MVPVTSGRDSITGEFQHFLGVSLFGGPNKAHNRAGPNKCNSLSQDPSVLQVHLQHSLPIALCTCCYSLSHFSISFNATAARGDNDG